MLALWQAGLLDRLPRWTPASIRRLGKRLLLRDNDAYRSLMATSGELVPDSIAKSLREDAFDLQTRLGIDLGFDSA